MLEKFRAAHGKIEEARRLLGMTRDRDTYLEDLLDIAMAHLEHRASQAAMGQTSGARTPVTRLKVVLTDS